MLRMLPCRLALLGSLALPWLALASRLVPGTLAERAQLAERIVYAQVLSSRTVARGGDPRNLETVTEVVVGQDLKGGGPARLAVHQLGGSLGLFESRIPGDAVFTAPETAILLLRCSAPDFCTLVALGEGKLKVLGAQVLQQDLARGTTLARPLGEVLEELGASLKVRAALQPAAATAVPQASAPAPLQPSAARPGPLHPVAAQPAPGASSPLGAGGHR